MQMDKLCSLEMMGQELVWGLYPAEVNSMFSGLPYAAFI